MSLPGFCGSRGLAAQTETPRGQRCALHGGRERLKNNPAKTQRSACSEAAGTELARNPTEVHMGRVRRAKKEEAVDVAAFLSLNPGAYNQSTCAKLDN